MFLQVLDIKENSVIYLAKAQKRTYANKNKKGTFKCA